VRAPIVFRGSLFVLVALAFASPALAINIVTNPSFTGSTAGWSTDLNTV